MKATSLDLIRSMTPPILAEAARKIRDRVAPHVRLAGASKGEFHIQLPPSVVKDILERNNIMYLDGRTWWFYSSYLYDHNTSDVLAAAQLGYLRDHVKRDALVFESGCGCGWFLIALAQMGFTNLSGSDILQGAANAAQEFAAYKNYPMKVWRDNGFAPTQVPDNIDVFIATQWLYSAWAGNYSDENKGLKEKGARQLLHEFVETYAGHITPGGLFMFTVVDSIADLRPRDTGIYPVRQSYEDVKVVLDRFGFQIEKRFFCVGEYQPRMAYIARKG